MSIATRPAGLTSETKRTGRVAVKLLDREGQFTARFATFNVIDRDNDVTLPGAFADGQAVKIAAWGHNWGALPVGRGTIRADSHAAYVDGEFFVDTAHGRDTYLTVKRLSEQGLQEWSYGYEVLDSEPGRVDGRPVRLLKRLAVHEVSPVLVGAGIDTRTEAIKGARLETPRQRANRLLGETYRWLAQHHVADVYRAMARDRLAELTELTRRA